MDHDGVTYWFGHRGVHGVSPRRAGRTVGVLAPEDWVNPETFYKTLAATGRAPLHEVVEAVVTPSTALTPAPAAAPKE